MRTLSKAHHQVMLSNAWYAALGIEIRQEIAQCGLVRDVEQGQLIYRRGAHGDGLYCVLAGAVRLSGTSAAGKEGTLSLMEPGNWFGELSTLDGLPRAHDARAHVDCQVLQVSPDHFDSLLDKFPSLSRHMLVLQSARMRALIAGMEAFVTWPVEKLFAARLLGLARQYGSRTPDGVEISLPLSQELLSQLIGVTRQRVNQMLRAWETEGIISQHYGHIIILTPAKLAKIAKAPQ